MKRVLPFLIIFVLLLAGCGGSAEPEVTPEMVLADSVAYMNDLAGFEFSITQEGPDIFLDAEKSVGFVEAAGHYVSPDKATTKVKIEALGMVAEITVISIGDMQWASNPLTSSFQELPPEYLFQPVQYLDGTTGFFPSLGNGLTELVMAEESEELEEMPGLALTYLSGSIPGSVISEASGGLINVETLNAELWVDTTTNQIHRVVLTDQTGESTWVFDFWSFGEIIDITAP
jgi:outer membrane lipoprotein-sorting protein